MNITVIVIETIILAVLFTAAVLLSSKNPLDTVYDMPQPIIDRCLELGMGVPQQEDHSLDHVGLNFNFANRPCELSYRDSEEKL